MLISATLYAERVETKLPKHITHKQLKCQENAKSQTLVFKAKRLWKQCYFFTYLAVKMLGDRNNLGSSMVLWCPGEYFYEQAVVLDRRRTKEVERLREDRQTACYFELSRSKSEAGSVRVTWPNWQLKRERRARRSPIWN